MTIIKARDVAYVRFAAPDLDCMRKFLVDFGMTEKHISDTNLYMASSCGLPFVHATELAEKPGFIGFGILLASESDLEALAASEGLSIEDSPHPGGGRLLRLVDPNGFIVEAIAGQKLGETAAQTNYHVWNQAGRYPRQSELRRVTRGSSHVRRLGHVVLGVRNLRESETWYKERFGFITSDEVQMAPDMALATFLRCDRGAEPSDHHTLFLLQRPIPPGYMHAAFEVDDIDDLMAGHEHLKQAGYKHYWGVGRHMIGGQIFDYWLDPYGHEIEHWTDGDQLVAGDGSNIASAAEVAGVQWGMEMPPIPGPPPAA